MAERAQESDPRGQPESQPSEVRYLPVRAEPRPVEAPSGRALEPRYPAPPPAAVAAAAGGFLAGVATFVLARVLSRREGRRAVVRALRRRRRGGVEVAGTRSFLVDVHLLRR